MRIIFLRAIVISNPVRCGIVNMNRRRIVYGVKIDDYRKPQFEIAPLFVNRWSPRALSGEAISREELMRLFEAARWAPSSMNNQPWRFLYALRTDEYWETFFDLLSPGNQIWCRNAGALIVVVSKMTFDFNGKQSRTHSYDAGAAWACLALQGSLQALVVHGMQGFDYAKAKQALKVTEDFQVEAMAAVGRPGKKDELPPQLQEREFPSGRKDPAEIVIAGPFRS